MAPTKTVAVAVLVTQDACSPDLQLPSSEVHSTADMRIKEIAMLWKLYCTEKLLIAAEVRNCQTRASKSR
jgi:hypothetical protein